MKRKVLLVLGVGGAFACGATDGWAASGAWSTPTALVSSLAQAGDYAVGMSARGEAVAAWTDNAGVFASVAEPGQGFDPPQRLARLVSPIPGRLLAVDGRGDALVVWTVANATRTSGLYASYRPAGGSFGAPQRISPNGVGADFGLDARGDATFVWMRWRSNGRPTTIDVVQRMASGALGGAQALETGVGEGDISISVDNRDDAVASWVSGSVAHATVRCALRRHGRKFGRAFPLSAPSGATNTAAGIDDTGRALVAWDAPYTGASVGFPYRDVDAATIRVGARRAVRVQRLIDSHAGGLVESGPSVSVSPHGDALVVWGTYGKSLNGSGRIEVARSTPGRPLKINATRFTDEAAQRLGSAIGANGDAVVAWTNLTGPDEASITSSATGTFSAVAPLSPPRRDAGAPAVAVDGRGDAIALWWDLGPATPSTPGSPSTPLLYATSHLR